MTEELFWTYLEQARNGKPASASPDKLAQVLTPLTDDQLSDFGLLFYSKLCDLNHWRLWGAGYVITGGMSDDSFHYFRSWIVGKGKDVFEVALDNPDDLGPFVDNPEVENESLEYVTIEMLRRRGSEVDPRDRSKRHPDFNPDGEPFEEDTLAADFPKLVSQFG